MKLSREFWLVATVLITTFGTLYLADTFLIRLPRAQSEGLAWLPFSLCLLVYGVLVFRLYRSARRTFQPFRARHWGLVLAWCIAWGALFALLFLQQNTPSLDRFFQRSTIWLILMSLSGSAVLLGVEQWRTPTRTRWAGIAALSSVIGMAIAYWVSLH